MDIDFGVCAQQFSLVNMSSIAHKARRYEYFGFLFWGVFDLCRRPSWILLNFLLARKFGNLLRPTKKQKKSASHLGNVGEEKDWISWMAKIISMFGLNLSLLDCWSETVVGYI